MAKRRSRRKSVHLARAAPSAKFLAHGASENAIARARIAAAGEVVARRGEWPTLVKVEGQDRKIAPATLGRNSDALDPARRIWMAEAATALTTAGEFPTLKAVQGRAGAVRLKDLARVEDALTDARRQWVTEHGAHPGWIDPADAPSREEAPGDVGAGHAVGYPGGGHEGTGQQPEEGAGGVAKKGGGNVDTTLLQKRIDRLIAERKKDRETIAELTAALAEEKESTRRALLPVEKDHAAFLTDAPAPRPDGRGRKRPQP